MVVIRDYDLTGACGSRAILKKVEAELGGNLFKISMGVEALIASGITEE